MLLRNGKSYGGVVRRLGRYARMAATGYSYLRSRSGRQVGNRVSTRFRYKGSGSRTRTQTKRRGAEMVKSGTAGVSHSFVKFPAQKCFKQMRMAYRLYQTNTFKQIDKDYIDWSYSEQGVQWVDAAYRAQISTIFSDYGASSIGADSTRFYVKCVKHKLSLTNQSNANCVVTIYAVLYRRDSFLGDFENPQQAWLTGMARQENSGTPAAATINTVGCTPFQSADFCRYFRVIKVTKVYLDPGKSHIHSGVWNVNKTVSDAMLDTTDSTAYGFRGLTLSYILVGQGMPVNDGTTATEVACGSGKIDIIGESTIESVFPMYQLKKYRLVDNQGTIATEKIINDETNAPDTYVQV